MLPIISVIGVTDLTADNLIKGFSSFILINNVFIKLNFINIFLYKLI